jgi:hypothetical protein
MDAQIERLAEVFNFNASVYPTEATKRSLFDLAVERLLVRWFRWQGK